MKKRKLDHNKLAMEICERIKENLKLYHLGAIRIAFNEIEIRESLSRAERIRIWLVLGNMLIGNMTKKERKK